MKRYLYFLLLVLIFYTTKRIICSNSIYINIFFYRLLSNPLSIIRNVYSSLFLSNNKNKLEKHDKINQNPIDMKEILMNVHEYKEDEQENITLSKAEKEKLEKNMKVLREKKNKKSTRAAIPTKEQKKEQHKKEADKHDDKEIQTVMILNWHKTGK